MEINAQVIKEIIAEKDVFVEFQPIISVGARRIVGVEELGRGFYQGEIIQPYYLFDHAKRCGKAAELDLICRDIAFGEFSSRPQNGMLFLNIDIGILDNPQEQLDILLKQTEEHRLSPQNIVIEISERSIIDNAKLARFARICHENGFLFCFDDVGTTQNDFQRITTICPDIVKIDRFIIKEIEESLSAQEAMKSITNLAKQVGAFTIVEGVETVTEVITCMLNGADFFQGYYFADPMAFSELENLDLGPTLDKTFVELNSSIRKRQAAEINSRSENIKLIDNLVDVLSHMAPSDYENALWSFVYSNSHVECAFLLDDKGVQISDTIMAEAATDEKRSPLFAPAVKGDRHEIKNYYYAVHEGLENPFITDWYISNATGRNCKTLSEEFHDADGNSVIVCVDLKYIKE